MIIRDLELRDIPTLVRWLNQFNDSFEYPGKRPINDEMAAQFFYDFLDNPHQSALVAMDKNNNPIATMGFAMTTHPWDGGKMFYKMFWYSAKPGAGTRLLRYVRDICKKGGVSRMFVSCMDDSTAQLLEAEGFSMTEPIYVYDFKRD